MRGFAASLIFFCCLSLFAEEGDNKAVSFDQAVAHLEEYCFTCHDQDTAEGDIILDGIFDSDGKITPHAYKLWERALYSVESGDMPPKKKKAQPSKKERGELAQWINDALKQSALEHAWDPGMVTMRRLTNAEYKHSIRELTGLWKHWSEGFVADGGGGEGFSNTGDVLFLSPEQLEKYLQRAREVANHAAILPGTGITFHEEPIGVRSDRQTRDTIEQSLRKWYRKTAGNLLPKDDEDLRESAYLLACWKWKHRDVTKAKSLDALAKDSKTDPMFLKNWWAILTTPQPESRYLALTIDAFAALPKPVKSGEQPQGLTQQILAIEKQRKAWYTSDGDWATTQRMQQDADGIRTYSHEIKLKPEDNKVHLLVTDLGDGNKGDIVHWRELFFQWPDGNWQNVFDWMGRIKQNGKPDQVKWIQPYTRLEGSHPNGREMEKRSFAVKAPSIVTLPVPREAIAFKAKGRLEPDAPGRDLASAQWAVVSGDRPKTLPSIMPGKLTVWHRLTPTHKKLYREFHVMKQCFPNNFDKRIEQVESNLKRWDNKPVGAYYLSNQQLLARVTDPNERQRFERLRTDMGYVGHNRLPESYKKEWDNRIFTQLQKFATRAWRRPVTDQEVEQLKNIYFEGRKQGMAQETAAQEALVSILVSPNFLYRVETGDSSEPKPSKLSHFEYASRLSYFLWSCPPDEALYQDAVDGKLVHNWENICAHVDRMLPNYRSFALAKEFGGQWLGFHDFYQLNTIDRQKFPEFTWQLKHLMYEENWRFLAKIIQERLPVTDITQANYTLLNEALANHYGIAGVKGDHFRHVNVERYKRGGIFGMSSFHAKTSYPVRTSPVLRGDWILRDVLGRPTPPPPDDVPELEESGKGGELLSLREQLEKHREDASCASCHDKIDPLGFALEKFDPIGRMREVDAHGKPIDNRGKTSDGMELVGIGGLKKWIKQEEDQFLNHFCTKLAGYALGREIGASDQLLIQQMIDSMKKWNYSFGAAVKPLVVSRQFQYRRNIEE